MRKTTILPFLLLTIMYFLFSCTKDNDNSNGGDEQYKKEISDLAGVWEGTENDTLFISINPYNKRISYYVMDYMMGYGQITKFEDNVIYVYNEHTGKTDEIRLVYYGDDHIQAGIRMKTKDWGDNTYREAHAKFTRTDEPQQPFTGETLKDDGYTKDPNGGWAQWRVDVTSENTATHYRNNSKSGNSKQEYYYCIQRRYKGTQKFLYCTPTESQNDQTIIFFYDGQYFKNNKRNDYL